MTLPRKALVSLENTNYYHCVSRCVRRAFLCGVDDKSGQSFEHRRKWIEDRLLYIGRFFTIKIMAYAIMNNHYHVVLHIDQQQAGELDPWEVISRWAQLFSVTGIASRFLNKEVLTPDELLILEPIVRNLRERLCSISWFMRCINEFLAKEANKEDHVTGRFWEGRFKSQALLDETAVVTCMGYVDLNPIRAKIADTPEESLHTSAAQRINAIQNGTPLPEALVPLNNTSSDSQGIAPIDILSYLELLDHTGRVFRDDKAGAISPTELPILVRLKIHVEVWMELTKEAFGKFKRFIGRYDNVVAACQRAGMKRSPGANACKTYFAT